MTQSPGVPENDPAAAGFGAPLPPPMPPPMPSSSMPPPPPPYGGPSAQWSYPAASPVPPGMAFPASPGMYFDPATGLTLPVGTALAPVGRRIGAYFLSIVLVVVTLVIGYLIWGAILWGRGTSPALNVLGMRVWHPDTARPAGWWRMALRDIIGGIVQGFLGGITGLVSFILFLATREHRSLCDLVGGTVVIHDPNKVLPQR